MQRRKTLILTLLLLVSWASVLRIIPFAYASGITRVNQNPTAYGTTGLTGTINTNSTPVTGDILVLVVSARNSTGSPYNEPNVTGVSESNVVWTRQAICHYQQGIVEIWFGVVGSGTIGTSITATFQVVPDSGYLMCAVEYSGVATSGFLDQTANSTGSSTSPYTGATSMTTNPNELFVGGYYRQGGNDISSPNNGFLLVDGTHHNAVGFAFVENISSVETNANCTSSDSNGVWAGCIATFFASAASLSRTATLSVTVSTSTSRTYTGSRTASLSVPISTAVSRGASYVRSGSLMAILTLIGVGGKQGGRVVTVQVALNVIVNFTQSISAPWSSTINTLTSQAVMYEGGMLIAGSLATFLFVMCAYFYIGRRKKNGQSVTEKVYLSE